MTDANDLKTLEFLNFISSLNETQKNILRTMMKDLASQRMKTISSDDAENYIKKSFEEIQLAA